MKPTHNINVHFGNHGSGSSLSGTGEIVAVNVRYGFRGRPILQVKRAHYRSEGMWPRPNRVWERSIGRYFTDAKRDDIPDLVAFFKVQNEPESE